MWCLVPSNPITPILTAGLNHAGLFSAFLGPGQFGYTLNINTDMGITCMQNWATKSIQVIKRHLSPGQKGPRSPGSCWTDVMFYFMQNLVIASVNSGIFCNFVHSSDVQHQTSMKVRWAERWRFFPTSSIQYLNTVHSCHDHTQMLYNIHWDFFLYHLVLFSHPNTLYCQNNR